MIFLTVGVQLPFDRLVSAVDRWAGIHKRCDVVAQVGRSTLQCAHLRAHAMLPASEYSSLMEKSEFVISHAGMGSIISAVQLGKPIIIMPRRSQFREHRNDHQFATSKHMKSLPGVVVVEREDQLIEKLDSMIMGNSEPERKQTVISADSTLIEAITDFVQKNSPLAL